MEHETFYWITWEVKQSGDEIWPVYVTLQKKICYQKILWKIWPKNWFQALVNVQKNPL